MLADSDRANQLVARDCRAPFVAPEKVQEDGRCI
jgi:hypothetical protein